MIQIIPKPWGREELLEKNDKYMVKRLTMLAGRKCSLQYHKEKRETIYILTGRLRIYVGENEDALIEKEYFPGDSITLKPGILHRMEGIEDSIYLEASTPEIDDVVRIRDDYKRV
jgi:mannose-6-phosphate isomerase